MAAAHTAVAHNLCAAVTYTDVRRETGESLRPRTPTRRGGGDHKAKTKDGLGSEASMYRTHEAAHAASPPLRRARIEWVLEGRGGEVKMRTN